MCLLVMRKKDDVAVNPVINVRREQLLRAIDGALREINQPEEVRLSKFENVALMWTVLVLICMSVILPLKIVLIVYLTVTGR